MFNFLSGKFACMSFRAHRFLENQTLIMRFMIQKTLYWIPDSFCELIFYFSLFVSVLSLNLTSSEAISHKVLKSFQCHNFEMLLKYIEFVIESSFGIH